MNIWACKKCGRIWFLKDGLCEECRKDSAEEGSVASREVIQP